MKELWSFYVDVFKSLITSGWSVYKTTGSTVYRWVYTHTSLPTKFRLGVASEINTIANGFCSRANTTRNIPYSCSVFYGTEDCIKGRWV